MAELIPPNAPVLVIGLGRFGAAVAGQLDRLGREVLAVDTDPVLVQKWSDRLTHTAQLDATNIDALEQIGARDFSIAVVAVGTSIEASVLITANLSDLRIPQIWAKAMSSTHGRILKRIGANHVTFPEAEAGERTAHLLNGRMLDFIAFDDNFVLAKMYPPKPLRNATLRESEIHSRYDVNVIGVKSPGHDFKLATADTTITSRDLLIVAGTGDRIERFSALR